MSEVIEKPLFDLKKAFVPVIFANGEDDDSPGLQAAADDMPVLYDDRIYMEGEDIAIENRNLRILRTVIDDGGPGRHILIRHCHISTR